MLFQTILILFLGAALLFGGGCVAQRGGFPYRTGLFWSLGLIALGLIFLPKSWQNQWVGNTPSDHFLVLARNFGVAGILFLSGIRTDYAKVFKARKLLIAGGIAALVIGSLLTVPLRFLGKGEAGAVLATIAAIAGGSLTVAGQHFSNSPEREVEEARWPAIGLTGVATVVIYFFSLLQEITRIAPSGTAVTIAVSYEVVKPVVLLSLACYVLSQFLRRTAEHISPLRRTLICAAIFAVFYVVALRALGQLGGLTWAFLAGTILNHSYLREKLGGSDHPIAEALFWSYAFFPLFFQSHGRSLTDPIAILGVVMIALLIKSVFLWIGFKLADVSASVAIQMTATSLPSGEVAVLFLGFGVTRWAINSALYFTVLLFAVISTLLGVALCQWSTSKAASPESSLEHPPAPPGKDTGTRRAKLLGILLLLGVGVVASGIQTLAADQTKAKTDAAKEHGTVSSSQQMETMLEAMREKVNRAADAAEVLAQAQAIYQTGEELNKRGNSSAAKAQYEKARQILLSAGDAQFYEPNVRAFFFRLSHQIAAITNSPGLMTGREKSLPPEANKEVTSFINYYQGRGRGVARLAMTRLRKYKTMMRRIFEEEGVPEDLIYVGLVESAYNPYARSTAGAHGIWQFVQDTGRRYGLKQTGLDDDRHDPEKSTRAAARYLHDLYEMFGDWPLALAAYNAGEYRILRLMEKTGIKDFWEMSRQRLLPQETRSYVPEVLAAIAIGKRNIQTRPGYFASKEGGVE